ncbi:helix-turn-helix domain-containing protein [Bradyrhizobium liaoningense]
MLFIPIFLHAPAGPSRLKYSGVAPSKETQPGGAADRCKVHQTYLSGVETGKRNPSLLVLERIARALDVDAEELVRRRRRRTGGAGDS